MKGPVIVLDYGMGNIHSIIKALGLYLSDVRYSKNEKEIRQARALVLPGDGAFGAAMDNLGINCLAQSIMDFAYSSRPILAICIGFQILFCDSEEGLSEDAKEKTKGLGFIPGSIKKFSFTDGTRVPHMGWNRLDPGSEANFFKEAFPASQGNGEYMYFIHSYYAAKVPEKFVIAYCKYGGQSFPAIVKKENILAAQFHPEKSGQAGLGFIEAWAKTI